MNKTTKNLLAFGVSIVGVLVTAAVVQKNVISPVVISGKSMNPTLANGDRGYVNLCVLKFRSPKNGEIIIFRDNIDKELVVKRVIGVPGDKISIQFSRVYVNGKLLDESYLNKGTLTAPRNFNNLTLRPNEYFMMGDNRKDSLDSRNYGPISIKDILGIFVW